jgi:hypothetical protein
MMIALEARAPALKRLRSWTLAADQDLFGRWQAVVIYGRIGRHGQTRRHAFEDESGLFCFVRRALLRRRSATCRIGVSYAAVAASRPEVTGRPVVRMRWGPKSGRRRNKPQELVYLCVDGETIFTRRTGELQLSVFIRDCGHLPLRLPLGIKGVFRYFWPTRVSSGQRDAARHENVGGLWGYREFLNAIADPSHQEHLERLRWIGGHVDPSDVDAETLAQAVHSLGKKGTRRPSARKRS